MEKSVNALLEDQVVQYSSGFAEDKGKEKVKFQSSASNLEKKLKEALAEMKFLNQAIELDLKLKEEALAEMKSLNQNLIAKECKSNDELQEVCKKLMDKEEDLKKMESTIQSLIAKERASNDELQEVREELIDEWLAQWSLKQMEALSHVLISRERACSDELVATRKEFIYGLGKFDSSDFIGIKRMGDLDLKPFYSAAKRKYYDPETEGKAAKLCSIWEDYIKDTSWHSFKIVMDKEGNQVKIINEDDEKLKGLKDEYGDKLYEAVTTVLTEKNEYSPGCEYLISELWNCEEGRKASLEDVVSYILKHWKKPKQKRNRRSVRELRKSRTFLQMYCRASLVLYLLQSNCLLGLIKTSLLFFVYCYCFSW